MTRSKRIRLIGGLAAAPVIALIAAGCGGGGSDSAAASAPPKTASGQATMSTASADNLGTILRDAGKPTVGSELNAALVGTTPRSDGMSQVTYNGHPLYLFAGDQKPGDIAGQGSTEFGGTWYALSPAGDQVTGQASSSSGGYGH